jgi:aminopeptidase N
MHGEAFPGLVHLSWVTFQQIDYEGQDEIFRAHEVAHQWWGISVDFKTYHDQWLSEGFSEYCGLWYLLIVKEDSEMFFDVLEKWRDEIINNREYLFGSGQEAGPICLGYRTNSTATKGDYDLIIYKKGAFVLHMLRGMLLNLKTMNEDRFENMMKDYFKTYFGKSASTEDFLKIVSKHFGGDMSWFFDQYVYGTDIPLYEFAYKTERTKDDKYLITCRVVQKNVDENFKMYVPLKIILDDDRIARVRVEVTGKEKIFQLPLLPEEPDEIIFNDLESVLCEVDYVDWN